MRPRFSLFEPEPPVLAAGWGSAHRAWAAPWLGPWPGVSPESAAAWHLCAWLAQRTELGHTVLAWAELETAWNGHLDQRRQALEDPEALAEVWPLLAELPRLWLTWAREEWERPGLPGPDSGWLGAPDSASALVWDGRFLGLRRLWNEESGLARLLAQRLQAPGCALGSARPKGGQAPLEAPWPGGEAGLRLTQAQAQALAHLGRGPLYVLSGGPGTGKTTTVSLALRQLHEQNPHWKVVLAAPTGRAAQRLQAGLAAQFGPALPEAWQAKTLHRLLGLSEGWGARPRFDAERPLDADLVIVDEASMLDLEVFRQLLEALAPETSLVLVGDKDQLPSLEAGAVLRDLSRVLAPDALGILSESRRTDQKALTEWPRALVGFGGSPLSGAALIESLEAWSQDREGALTWHPLPALSELPPWPRPREDWSGDEGPLDRKTALEFLETQIWLSPQRQGLWGAEGLNARLLPRDPRRPAGVPGDGTPLLVTRNHHALGLFNGDRGLVFGPPERWKVWFPRQPKDLIVEGAALSHWDLGAALSVHKSQGSEWDEVHLVLEGRHSLSADRQLLYTALTRARHRLRLYAEREVLLRILSAGAVRQTRLGLLLAAQTAGQP